MYPNTRDKDETRIIQQRVVLLFMAPQPLAGPTMLLPPPLPLSHLPAFWATWRAEAPTVLHSGPLGALRRRQYCILGHLGP